MADTLKFVDVLADQPIDYLHVSMGNVWRKSLNDKSDDVPTILKIKKVVNHCLPLISVGSVERPEEVEKLMDAGVELVALGRESLRDPNWVQKVGDNNEASINYEITKSELDSLGINPAFYDFTKLVHADLHLV